MTIGDWLRSRTPAPPPALAARLELVLAASLEGPTDQLPDACLAAGERLVAELLHTDSTSRESALDLLTADALVTYAFEAASERPSTIDGHAAAAMRRISALAATG